MPVLDVQNISKAIGPRTLLDAVDLTIQRGERVGLVGNNGCGKSTLARILAGVDSPDDGTLALRRGAKVALLSQAPSFEAGLDVRTTVRAGLEQWTAAKAELDAANQALERGDPGDQAELLEQLSRASAEIERSGGWDIDHRIETLLGHLGLSALERQPVETLSGGEQRRVALARLLISAPDLAILDEPTNHLDFDTIEWLEQYFVQSWSGAMLLITHDRYMLDRVAQRTLELSRGKLYSYDGGYEAYLTAKAERLAQEARAEANRSRYLQRELAWLRRQPKARTGKQKARQQRAAAAIEVQRATPAAERDVALRAEQQRSGKSILDIAELGVSIGGRVLVDGLTLTLKRRQRIGIIGPSGCGKTTLLRVLLGERAPEAGTVSRGKNTRFSYLSQLRAGLDPALSVRQNVAGERGHLVIGQQEVDVFSYLGRFLFAGPALDQPLGSLSGGERTRVALALMLSAPSNVMVLDEPTNDLDVQTISALESMLVEYQGSALVVSHDRWFLDRVSTDILAFEADAQVVHSVGNYRLYRELRARAARARRAEPGAKSKPTKSAGKPTSQPPSKPRPRGLTYAERLELDKLEGQVEAADQRVHELEQQLADPALYRAADGHERAAAHQADLVDARERAARLTARWEELELKRERAGG